MGYADETRLRLSLDERHSVDSHLLKVDKTFVGGRGWGSGGLVARTNDSGHSLHAAVDAGQALLESCAQSQRHWSVGFAPR